MNEFENAIVKLLPKMRVWALAWKRDKDKADDLVQDAIVRMLEKQESFIVGTNLSAWASRVMYNMMVSEWRVNKKRHMVSIETVINQPCNTPEHDSLLSSRELETHLSNLPKEQREALVLSIVESKTYIEIAATQGVSEGTVKSRISRGRDRLTLMAGYGVGSRADRVDELTAREAVGTDKKIVVARHPSWFCVYRGGVARVFGNGRLIAETSAPHTAWQRARETIEGASK